MAERFITYDRPVSKRIPESEWRWHGMPGHFIASSSCCFHMVTDIGSHRVSTIGCYHDTDTIKRGEESYENRKPLGAGAESLYETYVFNLDEGGEVNDWGEIDGERYATEEAAEEGHRRYCEKWAEVQTAQKAGAHE